MKIIDAPVASQAKLGIWLAGKDPHVRFYRRMLEPLWTEAVANGVEPVGMVIQAGHETAWGNFGGAASAWQNNPCGMRVAGYGLKWIEEQISDAKTDAARDALHRMSHATFATWHQGARAQAQHLRVYCGHRIPVHAIADPRYDVVDPPSVVHWRELSGRWAVPGEGYGERIETDIAEVLQL